MKSMSVILILLLCAAMSFGQLKSQLESQPASQSILRPLGNSSLLSWIDMNRFSMRHNFSMSYLSGGGSGLSLASYTNTMAYRISDPLQVRMDVTFMGSPFGGSGMYSKNDLSKLFISRAELNYRLGENSFLSVQYRQSPYTQWLLSDPFQTGWGYRSSFDMWGDE